MAERLAEWAARGMHRGSLHAADEVTGDAGRLRPRCCAPRASPPPRTGCTDGRGASATSTWPGAADVYWAGRLTLCAGPDDLERYDRAFAAYFAGVTAPPLRRVPPVQVVRPVAVPGTEQPAAATAEPEELPAATASEVEVLRHRDLAGADRGRARGRCAG